MWVMWKGLVGAYHWDHGSVWMRGTCGKCSVRWGQRRVFKGNVECEIGRRVGCSLREMRVRSPVIAAASVGLDRSIKMKIDLAKSLDRLDLSDCGLEEIPEEVFELEELQELSLAGNQISVMPEEVGNLRALERFVIAGNLLTSLPDSIGNLEQLQGFWCHGNRLEGLPSSFGNLSSLERCSLSGNRIVNLPATMGGLRSLELLEVAGNNLVDLPEEIGGMVRLKKLVLHGNRIEQIPAGIVDCVELGELMMQGNKLSSIPAGLILPSALKTVNFADNMLQSFDAAVDHLLQLETMVLYGNKLQRMPTGLLELPNIKNVWLEGNPFESSEMDLILDQSMWSSSLSKVGLDDGQIQVGSMKGESTVVQGCQICSNGPGYFKLQKRSSRTLVVAFGSAPGEPNWGGLLSRISRDKSNDAVFDILFVVDPRREWFGGCDSMFDHYYKSLEGATKAYDRCVMIGESMGGSAALMFANLATSVLAFCPQVDLTQSSIRPSVSSESWEKLRQRVLHGVVESNAHIVVLSGTWDHDINQVQQLDESRIQWKVFRADSHRLAHHLEVNGKLSPLVLSAMGFSGGSVRYANLL